MTQNDAYLQRWLPPVGFHSLRFSSLLYLSRPGLSDGSQEIAMRENGVTH